MGKNLNKFPMEILTPRRLKIANWLVLAVLTVVGYIWQGQEFSLGILLGGLLAVINFHLLHQALKGMLERAAAGSPEEAPVGRRLFCGPADAAVPGPAVVIFWLISRGWLNIFGLVVGCPPWS